MVFSPIDSSLRSPGERVVFLLLLLPHLSPLTRVVCSSSLTLSSESFVDLVAEAFDVWETEALRLCRILHGQRELRVYYFVMRALDLLD